jgi:surfeit locus 1 family protein
VSGHVSSLPVDKSAGFTPWRLFSRRWILATLLVIAGAALLARLGVWQLDRLAQRRLFNARVQAQVAQPQLELTGNALSVDLVNMEYRTVVVRGQYDFSRQVALRNQAWDNQAGVQLLTPLKIEGTHTYVLVERGWVPGLESTPAEWRQYDEPGTVEVRGIIRRSQSKPDFGRRADPFPAPGDGPLNLWYFANVERIAAQLPYPLLPVYVQQAPDPAWTALPYRSLPELDLTEGPHMSYALQWFSFAILLLVGYPFYVRKRELAR